MCETCAELLHLINSYDNDLNTSFGDFETDNDPDFSPVRPLTCSEVNVLCNYLHYWQQRHCSCIFKDLKNFDKLNLLIQGLLVTCLDLLKYIVTSLESQKGNTKEPGDANSEILEDSKCKDDTVQEFSKWTLQDKEKLLHLVSKTFHVHFPLYAVHKHNIQSRLEDLTQREAALLSTFCDPSDSEIPVLLLKNVSFFCEREAIGLLVDCFAKATPETLSLGLAHAIITVTSNLKYVINVSNLIPRLVQLRTCVISYLCKISDKDLRVPSNRNMFEFMWSVIKDPLDPRSIIDKEGLALALKYFTSSTLTMRLAGIAQINNYISLFNEFCQSENGVGSRQADGEELVDWILNNKIVEHIFGPNLHVEVIKQSHIALNFIVTHITPEHIDVIWSASHLKHCSRQVFDILTPLIKNMNVGTVLHLYSLLKKMEPKDHTEQTLILASCLLRFIWTKSLNIPEPSSGKGAGNTLEELTIVKSPIFTILPGSSSLRRHDSSTSASVDGSDEDDEDDFDMVPPKLLAGPQINSRIISADSASSCGTQSSSDEIQEPKNDAEVITPPFGACKISLRPSSVKNGSTNRLRQKYSRKMDSAPTDSDEDNSNSNKNYIKRHVPRKKQKFRSKNKEHENLKNSLVPSDETTDSINRIVHASLSDPGTEAVCNTEGEDIPSDSNSNSSQVSQSSQKNMADFDGEESASGCETELIQLSTSVTEKKSTAHHLTNIACIHSQHFRGQTYKLTKDNENINLELSKFTIDSVCKPGQTLLWDLLQDTAVGQLAEGLAHECEKILCNLICWLADRRIRMKFIEGCLENLSQSRSVIISLRLLPKLLMSFQQYRGGMDTHSITLWADSDRHMLRHFFSNLVLSAQRKHEATSEIRMYIEETQTRLHFLSFVFSFAGSPENFRLNREQVDTLWSCIANDNECRDELFNWMLNQVRVRDQHALDNDLFHYVLLEKMPQLTPEGYSMLALELLHYLCGIALSTNQNSEVVTVAIKQLWDIALKAINTDVSMSAIKHLNNYYIHLQHPGSTIDKEEEFIKQCMDYLNEASKFLYDDEEKHLTIIQRALILLKTHLEAFRCRYSFHLRLLQLNGDISIVSHLNKSCERAGQTIKILCQPAAFHERNTFEMNSSDFVGELRAEVTFWWKQLTSKYKVESSNSKQQNLPVDGPLRLLSQGQELTQDLDEKTLSEVGFKDMQLVYVSVGANRPSRKMRDSIEPASSLPPPSKDRLPSILLLRPEYFEQLFNLVQQLGSMKSSSSTRAQVLSRRVWEIIHILPTSPDLLRCFQSISSDCEENESPSTTKQGLSKLFNSLLSPASPQKLIYSVQIVEWLQNQSKNEENGWSQRFIDGGGLQHLFEIFVSGVLQQGESDLWNEWKQDCLACLLQLIYQFGVSHQSPEQKPEKSANNSTTQNEASSRKKRNRKGSSDKLLVYQFNPKLLSMLNDVESMLRVLLTILSETTSTPSDANSYQTGFWCRAQVVHHTLNFLTSWAFSDRKIRIALFKYPNVSALLKKLVLDDPDPAVRREACTGFYRMCLGVTNTKKSGLIFIPQLLNALLSFLPVAQSMRPPKAPENEEIALIEKEPFGPGCKDYFWLVCRLVDSLDNTVASETTVDLDHWSYYLAEAIEKREIRESRHSVLEDEGLRGLLCLMTVIIKHNPPFKTSNAGRSFLSTVFELLFLAPNQKEKHLPKCKMQPTRSSAFDLLVELAKGSEENHVSLMKLLCEQHDPNCHSPYQWDYWPHDDCRSECGYVGLINLGATCYMASCVQHLFMLPEARCAILSAKISNETKHAAVLHELQKMFAFLLESERKAYNPKTFCKVYTMDNQPLNTGEQKDMTEFFTDLISKLEEMVPLLKDVLKSLFSGTLSNNVVSLDCPHISRTMEEFYTLRCKVADMRHLWDSLDELTVKDTLEGDNMYTCSQCGRKVRAEKRACIKKLPRVLCFNTMRYTFNMVTMTKEKVNTHFSFPMRLDMSPYLEKNLIPGSEEECDEMFEEESSSEYELIGVTVHTGTADGGHYYCFIREPNAVKGKDKWYMFNDAEVKIFDPSQLAAECFGGEMTSKTYDSVTDKFMDFSIEKTNSAYMLFYERISKKSNASEASKIVTSASDEGNSTELPQELSECIWEDNMQFLRDKNIFEHTYFDFMWQICAYIPQTLNNTCSKIVTMSAQLATSFVLETLIHSKEKPTIANWIELLTKQFNASPESCEWLIDHLAENYLQWPVQILLKCPNQMVRQLFQRLCIHVISQLRASQASLYLCPSSEQNRENKDPLPDVGNCSCITRFVKKLLLLIKSGNVVIKSHLKHLTEYFTFLYEFAKLGDEECIFLLKVEAISLIVQFYLNHSKSGNEYVEVMSEDEEEEDESTAHHGFRGPYSHLQINLQEKFPKPASFDKMIMFVAYLVEKSRTLYTEQVQMNESDVETIFGGKAFPFLHRQIRDNINLRQSFHLIVSLCRANENAAASIVNMILNAINRQPDVSQPFFRILSMLVEHANEPSGIPLFSSFIYPRIWEIAEQNPHHCLEWLTAQVPRSKNAHSLVLKHLDTWVEYFLLSHGNQRVRNAAALLLISLVPNNIFRQSYYKSPRTLIMQHKDGLELNGEAVVIIQQIFSCLLQLLKNAKQYVDPQTHGTTKLTSYFAVMVYCLVSRNEKLMLVNYFMDLWNLFQPKLSEPAIPVNQNKQTLLYFWYQACIDCPENVRCIVQNSHVTRNIAFNYILADHDDQEVMLFNRVMLPSYYGLLRLCCSQSRAFTRHLALHQNIQWAFKNITPYFSQYQAAVGELFKLMKLFATTYPDSTEQEIRDVKQFKRTTLQMYLTSIDSRSYWTTLISVYTILVESEEDKTFVILNNGIIALFQSFNTLYMMFHEATACHVTNEIVDLLKIIIDLLRVLKSSTQAEVCEWGQKWKEHGEVIRKLILLLNTYTPADVRSVCTAVLFELIQIYPKDCIPVLVQGLGLGHLTFQDQYLNFSAGPFFPRRGQRAVLAKSSLRPQRPVFQMHFHPKMLEISLGTEEEYDKAVIDYYYPYYKFIASICKVAVTNNLVNQELVGFCSMVALENLPMHLPIFPQLWLEFIHSTEKGAKEFISILYSSCNYFKEYLTSILTNEQSFLDEDCVFEFLKECLPKVSSLVISQDVVSKMLAIVITLKEQMYNLDISKEDCNLIGELRALLLVFSCEVPPGLTVDLRTVFSKLKGRCTETEEQLSDTVETPQKKRKTKEELSVDESEDGSHHDNEDTVDHWKQRLDNIVSELMRILEIS